MSATGEGKRQLIEGIRTDLGRVRRECESLAHECGKIHEDAKGLNGWPAVWRGVSQLLGQAAAQLREAERGELPRLQSGAQARIVSDLNEAQVHAVQAARSLGNGAAASGPSEPSKPSNGTGVPSGPAPSRNGAAPSLALGSGRNGNGGTPIWAIPSRAGGRSRLPSTT